MGTNFADHFRVLAVAPTTRGIGYVVFEDGKSLVDWAVKAAVGDKNVKCLKILEDLLSDFHPAALVMEDLSAQKSRRCARIRKLSAAMIKLAGRNNIEVALLTREQMRKEFFGDSTGTKQQVAEKLAFHFPDELADRLPPKRRPWTSETARMGIFDAMALAFVFFRMREKDGEQCRD